MAGLKPRPTKLRETSPDAGRRSGAGDVKIGTKQSRVISNFAHSMRKQNGESNGGNRAQQNDTTRANAAARHAMAAAGAHKGNLARRGRYCTTSVMLTARVVFCAVPVTSR